MELAVLNEPRVSGLIGLRVENLEVIRLGNGYRRGLRADYPVYLGRVLCRHKATCFLTAGLSVIEGVSGLHSRRGHGNDGDSVEQLYHEVELALLEIACVDELGNLFIVAEHIVHGSCHDDNEVGVSGCVLHGGDVLGKRGQNSARRRGVSPAVVVLGKSVNSAVTVSVHLRNDLCALEFAHDCGSAGNEIAFVHVHLVQQEFTAPVHGHGLGFVGQGNGSLGIAGIAVIIAETAQRHLRDLDLSAAGILYLSRVVLHPAGGRALQNLLIEGGLEYLCRFKSVYCHCDFLLTSLCRSQRRSGFQGWSRQC